MGFLLPIPETISKPYSESKEKMKRKFKEYGNIVEETGRNTKRYTKLPFFSTHCFWKVPGVISDSN